MQEDDIERSERHVIMFLPPSITNTGLITDACEHAAPPGLSLTHYPCTTLTNSLQRTLMKIETLTSTSGCVKSLVHQILCLQNQSHYMSQNLLRGNNETNDLKSDLSLLFTIGFCTFMG